MPMPMSTRPGFRTAARRAQVFPFRFDRADRYLLLALGVTPGTSGVTVSAGRVSIRYGPWRATVDRRNVRAVTASGPFQAWKAIGPRVSLADRGLTFGTSTQGGVCIQLRQPVGVLMPRRLLAHPALTVTVEQPGALIRLLRPGRLRQLSPVTRMTRAAGGRPRVSGRLR